MTHEARPGTTSKIKLLEKVALGDIEIAFTQSGEGAPVVLIHGLGEDHASWDPVVNRLNNGYRAYTPDLRGHGATTLGDAQGSLSQLGADLLAFLAEVSGPAVCVGFSLGGVIVLEAALQNPSLVRQAVVVGTSSKVGRAAANFFRQRIEQAQSDLDAFKASLAQDTAAQIARNRDAVAHTVAARLKAVGDGAGYVNAAQAMVGLAEAPLTERLRGIQVPVSIIQGMDDTFCPPKAAEIMREAMPDAGYFEIPDTGHLMSVDQPDLLAQALTAALLSCGGVTWRLQQHRE